MSAPVPPDTTPPADTATSGSLSITCPHCTKPIAVTVTVGPQVNRSEDTWMVQPWLLPAFELHSCPVTEET